jgi:hypothetical protein
MLTVYGSSDDLIEVEGDVEEEFTYRGDGFLAFSDGTLLSVTYDDNGVWRFLPLSNGVSERVIDPALGVDGHRDDYRPAYSDIVTMQGDFVWVVYGAQRGVRKRA